MSYGSDYHWCDFDETLMRYDNYKSSTLDESKTSNLPPFLQFSSPPPIRNFIPPIISRMTFEEQEEYQSQYGTDSLFHRTLQNVAPRLLTGAKPGSSSTAAPLTTNPLPPYKTVICRAFYAKGKCFRAEPDKCWFVHDISEMRLMGDGDHGSLNSQQNYAQQRQVQQQQQQASSVLVPKPVAKKTIPASMMSTSTIPADPRLFKTEICRFYETSGGLCRFGASCTFAHGVHELRRRRDEKESIGQQQFQEMGQQRTMPEEAMGQSQFQRYWGE